MAGQIAVVNAGGWGTALAGVFGKAGDQGGVWGGGAELAAEIEATGENRAYLPGVTIPPPVWPSASLSAVLDGAEAVMLVPISRAARETARLCAPHLRPGAPVVHASKGFELPSLLRLTEVVGQELGMQNVAVLSGPTHAEEVGRGTPTAAVVACGDSSVAATFQSLLHGPTFRVYTS